MKISELKVLICDDSILVRKKLKDFFKTLQVAEIYEAVNGQEAVDNYKKYSPDLVLMDLVMPVKTGTVALREIVEYDSKAKVVVASSIGTQSNLTEALSAGATDFLQKPINNDDILKIINSLIK